jgi:hypothetical protein
MKIVELEATEDGVCKAQIMTVNEKTCMIDGPAKGSLDETLVDMARTLQSMKK